MFWSSVSGFCFGSQNINSLHIKCRKYQKNVFIYIKYKKVVLSNINSKNMALCGVKKSFNIKLFLRPVPKSEKDHLFEFEDSQIFVVLCSFQLAQPF